MVPSGVVTMIANGHEIFVENSVGNGAGFSDAEYFEAGATILETHV